MEPILKSITIIDTFAGWFEIMQYEKRINGEHKRSVIYVADQVYMANRNNVWLGIRINRL